MQIRRFLRRAAVCAAALLLAPPTFGQSSFFVWQGFSQHWTYPHPPLRWGDAFTKVKCNEKSCTATHEQISSTHHPDRSTFFCLYSFCTAPGVKAYSGKHTFKLSGHSGESARADAELSVSTDSLLPAQENYVAVLSGFDVKMSDKPLPIKTFSVDVGDGFFNPSDQSVRFAVNAEIDAGKSGKFECEVTVHYLILCGDGALTARAATFQRRYFWDKKLPLEPQPQRVELQGTADPLYELGVPAFRRLRFALDKAHNFVGTEQYIEEINYDPITGKAEFSLNLQWKQWQDGMKANKRYRKHARRFARKKTGVADCYADIVLLQARQGCVEESEIRAENSWAGRPAAEPGDDIYRSSLQHLISPDCRE